MKQTKLNKLNWQIYQALKNKQFKRYYNLLAIKKDYLYINFKKIIQNPNKYDVTYIGTCQNLDKNFMNNLVMNLLEIDLYYKKKWINKIYPFLNFSREYILTNSIYITYNYVLFNESGIDYVFEVIKI